MSDKRDRPGLRVIRGGRGDAKPKREAVQVVLAPRDQAPFTIAALVLEEDTYLVLSAQPEARGDSQEHPIRVMTALLDVEPEPPGSIVVRERTPIEILAIVHDLEQDPSWSEEWVASALERAISECERRKLRAIGLEMLGTVHGRLARPRFLQILRQALQAGDCQSLERIWLVAPE